MIHWHHPNHEWIVGRDRDTYSQFGEDGLVDAILERIGTANLWAFECGASDGLEYSNTARLCGWNCVLMDSDAKHIPDLIRHRPGATVIHGRLGPNGKSLDEVLSDCRAPIDIDLVVIDIDGQDYWVLDAMKLYIPRVIMVETECPNKDSEPPRWGDTAPLQAGRKQIHALLEAKGYTVIVQTECNAIGVRNDLVYRLEHAT